jgi:hypothetical protein
MFGLRVNPKAQEPVRFVGSSFEQQKFDALSAPRVRGLDADTMLPFSPRCKSDRPDLAYLLRIDRDLYAIGNDLVFVVEQGQLHPDVVPDDGLLLVTASLASATEDVELSEPAPIAGTHHPVMDDRDKGYGTNHAKKSKRGAQTPSPGPGQPESRKQ